MPSSPSPKARNSARRAAASRRRRRTPLATTLLIGAGLLATGGAYAGLDAATSADAATTGSSAQQIAEGEALFTSNCATCHGMSAEGGQGTGPSLIGVGAAAVDFQVGTGRMPMQANGAQAPSKPVQFSPEQIDALSAYVASLAPGPAVPDERYLDLQGDAAHGAELFRVNCAMCHNVAGAGGALTEGKFAPELQTVEPVHIYEAMATGPQNMPVFNDMNLTPEDKRDIITALKYQANTSGGVAGEPLGSLGPVSEGLFIWIFGIGSVVAIAAWLTARPN